MVSVQQPIIIVGAGISGLTLAQACRKEGILYRVYERDETPSFRSSGWGLTLNWALPTFRALLPNDILSRLPETFVNREAVDAGEKGNFTFYDLSTGEAKWKVPASDRIRVSRERLRKLMLSNIEIEWGKVLQSITQDGNGVTAHFADGSTATGSLLVACDGSRSATRRALHGDSAENYQLPIRLIGVGASCVESQLAQVRALDPYFFQGADPKTDVFIFFSILEAPGDFNAPAVHEGGESKIRCQVMMSWPYREGFFGRVDPTNVPNTQRGMLIWMKTLSAEWSEPFRSLIQDIREESEIKPIELIDWLPQRSSGSTFGSRVALVGDAAHAMVMYRGEGANHAIVDVSVLLDRIRPLYQAGNVNGVATQNLAQALRSYEDEMLERTELAVLASRQACLDAHNHERLNDKSPLVRRRLMRADLEEVPES